MLSLVKSYLFTKIKRKMLVNDNYKQSLAINWFVAGLLQPTMW